MLILTWVDSDIRLDDELVEERQCHFWEVQYNSDRPSHVYVRNMSLSGTTYIVRKGERIPLSPYAPAGRGWLIEPNTVVQFAGYTVTVQHRYLSPIVEELDVIQQAEYRQFQKDFEICDIVMGSGGQGEVRLALNLRTKEQCVVKIVNLVKMVECAGPRGLHWINRCRREAEVLGQLNHHNVVKLITHYRSAYSVFLFLELASGGDLTSYMLKTRPMRGSDCQGILRQVVSGLRYIHDRGLVHRDLKPCNILLASIPRGTHRVCISDFGCADIFAARRLMSGVGTRGYQAPEVQFRSSPQTTSADMWSLGMVAVDMYGSRPSLARDFIQRCLRIDPNERMTIHEAAEHPFLKNNDAVWSVVERIQEQGIPKVTPITTFGGELIDQLWGSAQNDHPQEEPPLHLLLSKFGISRDEEESSSPEMECSLSQKGSISHLHVGLSEMRRVSSGGRTKPGGSARIGVKGSGSKSARKSAAAARLSVGGSNEAANVR
ncbi:unnamed protein product [Parascedosporium putredinis]|uniref:Protein kinase domain-containing protein n=1 Tax=Parascedosporium putredinis TaxID=1442378 RepID=A0A9P1HAP8_9PEZI|nr:unnamed protein product [Parascedosporium putredinis]CAI8003103.1 unnamed protein product [Parascedosporium putredinis]